jgi:hypothetical protein
LPGNSLLVLQLLPVCWNSLLQLLLLAAIAVNSWRSLKAVLFGASAPSQVREVRWSNCRSQEGVSLIGNTGVLPRATVSKSEKVCTRIRYVSIFATSKWTPYYGNMGDYVNVLAHCLITVWMGQDAIGKNATATHFGASPPPKKNVYSRVKR